MKDETEFTSEIKSWLGAAMDELKAAESQVTRLKRRIEGLKETLASFEQARPQADLFPLSSSMKSSARSLSQMSIKDAAKAVLKEHGEPMTAREIFDAMVTRGRKPGGKSPIETLRAILRSTEDVFKRTPDSKWVLADPEAELIKAIQDIGEAFKQTSG